MGYLENFTLEDTISAYETTMEVTGDNGEHCYSPIDEITLIFLKELKAYRDLEEKGLLPKFHLGDEFWTVRCREVLKSKIVMLQQKKDGTWRYRFSQEISSKYHDTSDYEEKDYGKYFFDVKEEAEKLAEKKKKQWEEELKRLEEKRKKSTEAKGE